MLVMLCIDVLGDGFVDGCEIDYEVECSDDDNYYVDVDVEW